VSLLAVTQGAALLARRLVYIDADGRPVMTGRSFHRADLVRYAVQIALQPDAATPTFAAAGHELG